MVKTVEVVNKMLEMGVIKMSDSLYSSPIVSVAKTNNTFRFCVDFRNLNSITVLDTELRVFAKSSDHKLSWLDMSKRYWQVQIIQSPRPLTAFQIPLKSLSVF